MREPSVYFGNSEDTHDSHGVPQSRLLQLLNSEFRILATDSKTPTRRYVDPLCRRGFFLAFQGARCWLLSCFAAVTIPHEAPGLRSVLSAFFADESVCPSGGSSQLASADSTPIKSRQGVAV